MATLQINNSTIPLLNHANDVPFDRSDFFYILSKFGVNWNRKRQLTLPKTSIFLPFLSKNSDPPLGPNGDKQS